MKLPFTLLLELAAGACVAAGAVVAAVVAAAVAAELFAGFELFAAAVALAVAAAVDELDDDEADAVAVVSAPATGAPAIFIALLDPN